MSAMKKANKSKVIPKRELVNKSQFPQTSSKVKRMLKRQSCEFDTDEEDISKLIGLYQTSVKKKVDAGVECKESRQKLLNVLEHHLDARNAASNNLLQKLSEVQTQIEADSNALKDNEEKLGHLAGSVLKCVQQSTKAQKQNLKTLKKIHDSYKKESEEMEMQHKADTDKLAEELEDDMNKLQHKLISEAKRKQYENLCKTVFHALKNDL